MNIFPQSSSLRHCYYFTEAVQHPEDTAQKYSASLTPFQAAQFVSSDPEYYCENLNHSCKLILNTPFDLKLFNCDQTGQRYTIHLADLIARFTLQLQASLQAYLDPDSTSGTDWRRLTVEGYGSCWRDIIIGKRLTSFEGTRDLDFRIDLSHVVLREWHDWAHIRYLLRESLNAALEESCCYRTSDQIRPWIFQGSAIVADGQEHVSSELYSFYRLLGTPSGSTTEIEIEFWISLDPIRTYTSSNEDLFLNLGYLSRISALAQDCACISSKAVDPAEALLLEKHRLLTLIEPNRLGRLGALRVLRSAAKGFDWPSDHLWQRAKVLSLIRQRPTAETTLGITKMLSQMQHLPERLLFMGYTACLDDTIFKEHAQAALEQLGCAAAPLLQPLMAWLLADEAQYLKPRLSWISPFLEACHFRIEDAGPAWQAWGEIAEDVEEIFRDGRIGECPPRDLIESPLFTSVDAQIPALLFVLRRLRHLKAWIETHPDRPAVDTFRELLLKFRQHAPAGAALLEAESSGPYEEAAPVLSPAPQELNLAEIDFTDVNAAIDIFEAIQTDPTLKTSALRERATACTSQMIHIPAEQAEGQAWLVLSADLGDAAALQACYTLILFWLQQRPHTEECLQRSVTIFMSSGVARRHLRTPAGLGALSIEQILEGLRIALRDRLWPEAPPLSGLVPPRHLLMQYADQHSHLRSTAILIDIALRDDRCGLSSSNQMLTLRPLFWLSLRLNQQPPESLYKLECTGSPPSKRQWEKAIHLCRTWDEEAFTDWLATVLDNLAVDQQDVEAIQHVRWELMSVAEDQRSKELPDTAFIVLALELLSARAVNIKMSPDKPLLQALAYIMLTPGGDLLWQKLKMSGLLFEELLCEDYSGLGAIFEYIYRTNTSKAFWQELEQLGRCTAYRSQYAQCRADWISCRTIMASAATESLSWRLDQLPSLSLSQEELLSVLSQAHQGDLPLYRALDILEAHAGCPLVMAEALRPLLSNWPVVSWRGYETRFVSILDAALQHAKSATMDMALATHFDYLFCGEQACHILDAHTATVAAKLLLRWHAVPGSESESLARIRASLLEMMRISLDCREAALSTYIAQHHMCPEFLGDANLRLTYLALLAMDPASAVSGNALIASVTPDLVPDILVSLLNLEHLIRGEPAYLPAAGGTDELYLSTFVEQWRTALSKGDRPDLEAWTLKIRALEKLISEIPVNATDAFIVRLRELIDDMRGACRIEVEWQKTLLVHLDGVDERLKHLLEAGANYSLLLNEEPDIENSTQHAVQNIRLSLLRCLGGDPRAMANVREMIFSCCNKLSEITPEWCSAYRLQLQESLSQDNGRQITHRVFNVVLNPTPAEAPANYAQIASITLLTARALLALSSGSLHDRAFMLRLLTLRAQNGDDMQHLFHMLHGENEVVLDTEFVDCQHDPGNYLSAIQAAIAYARETENSYLAGLAYNNLLQLLCPKNIECQHCLIPLMLEIIRCGNILCDLPTEFRLLVAGHFICYQPQPASPENELNILEIVEDTLKSIRCSESYTSDIDEDITWRERLRRECLNIDAISEKNNINFLQILINCLPAENNLSTTDLLNVLKWSMEQAFLAYQLDGLADDRIYDPSSLLLAIIKQWAPTGDIFTANALRPIFMRMASKLSAKLYSDAAFDVAALSEHDLYIVSIMVAETLIYDPCKLAHWENFASVCVHCERVSRLGGRQYLTLTHQDLVSQHVEFNLRRHFGRVSLMQRLHTFTKFRPAIQAHGLHSNLIQLLEIILDIPAYASLGGIADNYHLLEGSAQADLVQTLTYAKDLVSSDWLALDSSEKSLEAYVFGVSCCTILYQLNQLDNSFALWRNILSGVLTFEDQLDARSGRLLLLALHPLSYVMLEVNKAKPQHVLSTFVKMAKHVEGLLPKDSNLYCWIQRTFLELSSNIMSLFQGFDFYKAKPQIFAYFLKSCATALRDSITPESIERDLPSGVWTGQQLITLLSMILESNKSLSCNSQPLDSSISRLKLCIEIHDAGFQNAAFVSSDTKHSLVSLIADEAQEIDNLADALPALVQVCWSQTENLKLSNTLRRISRSIFDMLLPSIKANAPEIFQRLMHSSEPLAGCTMLHIMLLSDAFDSISTAELTQLYKKVYIEISAAEQLHGDPIFLRCLPLLTAREHYTELLSAVHAWASDTFLPTHLNSYGAVRFYDHMSPMEAAVWQGRMMALDEAIDTAADPTGSQAWLKEAIEALHSHDEALLKGLLARCTYQG